MYVDAVGITPSDSATLPYPTHALMVGVAGNVRVVTARGSTQQLALIPGYIYPLAVKQVTATGTTATGIVGLTLG